MSADGEIAVSVRAEGADEAAGELGGDGDGLGGGGPDAPDGDGGGGGGRFGKLLSRIAGLLVFLGPIFDVLGAIAGVITAFVAPLAVMLLRILTPLIRLLLTILPVWLDLTSRINDALGVLMSPLVVLIGIVKLVSEGIDRAASFLSDVRTSAGNTATRIQDMLATLRELPQRIGNLIPSVGGEGGLIDRGTDAIFGGDDSGGGGTSVTIGGGLIPFVDRITRDGSVDFP